MRLDRIEIQPYANGEWRWHKRAPNGQILCQGEGHKRWDHAVRAARRANLGCNYELSVRDASHRVTFYAQAYGANFQEFK